MSGDFKIKFEAKTKQLKCKFYFWLNIAAILYNNEMKQVTTKRNALKNTLLAQEIDKKQSNQQLEVESSQEEMKQADEDLWTNIHFEDFTEIEENYFQTDKERNAVMYPEKYEK